MRFAAFMARPAGRALRIAAGLALVAAGSQSTGWARVALPIVGAVPFMAGALNLCFLAPFLRTPVRGQDALRAVGDSA